MIARLLQTFNRLAIAGKLMAVAGIAIGALLLVGFSLVIVETDGVVKDLTSGSATAQAEAEGRKVATELARVEAITATMAKSIGGLRNAGLASRPAALAILEPNATAHPFAVGSWFMAEPNAFGGADSSFVGQPGSTPEGHFMPYYVREGDKVILDPGPAAEDYEQDYYRKSRDSGEPAMIEPYVEDVEGTKVTMASITVPVKSGGRVIGVAGIDVALDDMSKQLAETRPFGTGRVMLLSMGGLWVAHPEGELLMKPYSDAGADAVKQAIATGETQVIDGIEMDGEPVLRFVRPIRLPGVNATWALVMDVPQATISAPARRIGWELVLGGLLILGAVLFGLRQAARSIIGRPMAELSSSVDRLAKGENLPVPHVEREDEIGTLARAADVFRQAAADQAAADARLADEQKVVTTALGDGLAALSRGDLTVTIEAEFPSGYAALKANFNDAAGKLRQMIASVAGSALGIRTGSQEIAQASEDLARRTESNAASLEETSAALTQIDDRLKATADAAARTVARADGAIATVGGGREVAESAVQAMGRVRESATGIDEVIEGVDKIAFQTRVLAMNAAVEAGRAGEAGRGFAVVADLVSALAMRAEEEAKRAREQLTLTQADIVTAVEAVEKVDGALQDISGDVGEVHVLLNSMAEDNQAHSTAITQISAAIRMMDQSTQQNAAMVEQTSAAALSLTNEAMSMSDQAMEFRTVDGTGAGADRMAA